MDQADEEDKAKPFRLLDLPPELWTKIVKLAVERGRPFYYLNPHFERENTKLCNKVAQPAITRTCKLLRQLTIPHFYGSNAFVFTDRYQGLGAFIEWIEAIGPLNCSHLRELFIDSYSTVLSLRLRDYFADQDNFPFTLQLVSTYDNVVQSKLFQNVRLYGNYSLQLMPKSTVTVKDAPKQALSSITEADRKNAWNELVDHEYYTGWVKSFVPKVRLTTITSEATYQTFLASTKHHRGRLMPGDRGL